MSSYNPQLLLFIDGRPPFKSQVDKPDSPDVEKEMLVAEMERSVV